MQERRLNWDRLPGRMVNTPAATTAQFAGKRVLITGAAGCIGSALAQSVAHAEPCTLVLLDTSEHGVYELHRDFASHPQAVPVLGNVCDLKLMTELFEQFRPQIVYHAAAFKHVPLLEKYPLAAVANNCLGTAALMQSALAHGAEQVILVSTDKAADPISVMGVSKRIAELLLLAPRELQTTCKIVRLGNVLGSPGSIVPLFLEQIAAGLPLTVTHAEVERFFMTTEEAVAALLDVTQERYAGGVYVPAMGRPIRIVDLGRYVYAAVAPDKSSGPEVLYTMLRPGDKLEEVLIAAGETWDEGKTISNRKAILRHVHSPSIGAELLEEAMVKLQNAVEQRNLTRVLELVRHLVPGYRSPTEMDQAIKAGTEVRE